VYVVLASSNPGKLAELRALLPGWLSVRSASECGVILPDETGETFEENALLKARSAMEQTGQIAVADDSGLEVDALDGAPGVRSSRFAGEPADDARNNALLLERLADIEEHDRGARFRSVVAVASPEGDSFVAEGVIEGSILREPRGTNGFGYDPLFLPRDFSHTMAELTLPEKNAVSHRGRAFRAAVAGLLEMVERSRNEDVDVDVR
jgi:XTP/dITP diphosphohydrolase